MLKHGLRDQGAEQDRERLAEPGRSGGRCIIALAGSPTRAGSVADISTPIIVAEVKSRRRSVATGSAERAAWNQAPARKNIERHMKAVAISTQAKSDRTALSTTESKPIPPRRQERQPDAPHRGSGPDADPAGDPAAPARGRVDRDGSGDGIRIAGIPRQPVGGGRSRSAGRPVSAPVDRLPAPRSPAGRRFSTRSAIRGQANRSALSRPARAHRGAPLRARRGGDAAPRRAAAGLRAGSGCRRRRADDIGVSGDLGGHDRCPGGEGLGQHHPEALTGERRRAEHVGGALAPPRAGRARRRPSASMCPIASGSARLRAMSSGAVPTTRAGRERARPAPRRRGAGPAGPCAPRRGRRTASRSSSRVGVFGSCAESRCRPRWG